MNTKTLREKIEAVNDRAVNMAKALKPQRYYLFFNTTDQDSCMAISPKTAAKLFQRANKRLTGRTIPLDTVIKFVTPEIRSVIL